VAFEVATELDLPLDIFLVRKLGIPGHEEAAMGAISTGDVCYLDKDVISSLHITQEEVDNVIKKERLELKRRNELYRSGKPAVNVENHTVIIIDDGIATGSTMKAAILALKKQHVNKIIVATPVSSASAYAELSQMADGVVCIEIPEPFYAVGRWYTNFSQTEDEEVRELLNKASSSYLKYKKLG
jgi:putative phosphoribosyl transferase